MVTFQQFQQLICLTLYCLIHYYYNTMYMYLEAKRFEAETWLVFHLMSRFKYKNQGIGGPKQTAKSGSQNKLPRFVFVFFLNFIHFSSEIWKKWRTYFRRCLNRGKNAWKGENDKNWGTLSIWKLKSKLKHRHPFLWIHSQIKNEHFMIRPYSCEQLLY